MNSRRSRGAFPSLEKYLTKTTVGWIAIGFGVFTAVTPAWAATTRAGAACTLAMGVFTAYYGMLGLLVRNPTPIHWGLVVVGLALFIAPWIAGFASDRAAWTAWVSGFVALALGLMAWMRDGPPTETGINVYGIGDPKRRPPGAWVGWPALALGITAVVLAVVAHSSPAATGFTVGLGGLTAALALWSLLASDPTGDHLKIATTGLALFIAPWVAGFAADRGAWAAWVTGFIVTALGVVGYVRDESLDNTRLVRDEAVATYQRRFPHSGVKVRGILLSDNDDDHSRTTRKPVPHGNTDRVMKFGLSMTVEHAERQREWTGEDGNHHHSDAIDSRTAPPTILASPRR